MTAFTAIIGIDPGAKGAIGIIRPDASLIYCEAEDALSGLPGGTMAKLESFQNKWDRILALVELPQPWTKGKRDGWQSIAKINRSCGWWCGYLTGLGFDVRTVEARTWQTISKGYPGDSKKKVEHMLKAEHPELYKACLGPRGAYHDGKGDALAIALYGRCLRE